MKKVLLFFLSLVAFTAYAQKKVNVEVAYSATVSMDASLEAAEWKNAKEYPFHLAKFNMKNWPKAKRKNVGNKMRYPAYAKFLWNEKSLFVGVMMEDSDVVTFGEEDQTHLYNQGDCIEVFLKPVDKTYYWEIYGTPTLKKSVFFYPGRGRRIFPACEDHPVDVSVAAEVYGTLNNWHDKDKGWSVIIEIPLEMLERQGYPLKPGTDWTILVARQNFSADLPEKEYSSHTPLSQIDYHLLEDYGKLTLLPAGK